MVTTYGMRDLYGGAMTVELPTEFIDSSNLRQIPDHQEVFLSPSTLTSIIFEINAYVKPSTPANQGPTTTTTTATRPDGTTTTTTTTIVVNGQPPPPHESPEARAENDAEAAKFHFTDVIAPPDRLAQALPAPQRLIMAAPSLASFPTYILSGNILSYETARRQQGQVRTLPPSASSSQADSTISASSASSSSGLLNQNVVLQLQLLVRLERYETDLCVRVNVPMKEILETESEEGVLREEAFAKEILAKIAATLDVQDWGLFGTDE